MWCFVFKKKKKINQQLFSFFFFCLFVSNQMRGYDQKARRSYTGSHLTLTDTANVLKRFAPATRRMQSAAHLSLGSIFLTSQLALHLAGKFRKIGQGLPWASHTPVTQASSTDWITYWYLSTNLVYITCKLKFVSLHYCFYPI